MASGSSMDDAAVVANYDFSGLRRIVDVGGGQGSLLAAILEAYPTARGVLIERPTVANGARAALAERGLLERCEVMGGDFMQAVPEGGDCYMLKSILHNWDDA